MTPPVVSVRLIDPTVKVSPLPGRRVRMTCFYPAFEDVEASIEISTTQAFALSAVLNRAAGQASVSLPRGRAKISIWLRAAASAAGGWLSRRAA